MISPYKEAFLRLSSKLASLGFKNESDSSHGAVYVRPDGYRLTISIERYGDGCTVDLEKSGGEPAPRLSSLFLMEALAPQSAINAVNAFRQHGNSEEGLVAWWTEFLDFLHTHEQIIFTHSLPEPYRSRYFSVCTKWMRETGLDRNKNGDGP